MGAQTALTDCTPDPGTEPATSRLAVRGMCLSRDNRIILDDVSLELDAGEIFGLLGPNGAGKTSLMRCLMGLQRPDRGTVWVNGRAVSPGARSLRAEMGVVFQQPSLDNHLTACDNLLLGAALFGVPRAEAKKRAHELLTFMELADRGNERVRTFSGGMRRRLELARALIHRPGMLLLDEPTTGLDIGALERTWNRLLALRELQGLTMLLSTHHAEEAMRCDRLLVMDRGHVIACDSPQGLLRRVAGDVIVIEAEEPHALAAQIVEKLEIVAHAHEDHVIIERDNGHALVPRIVEALEPGRIRSIAVRQPTLADAFFNLTGRGLRKSPATQEET